MLFHMTNSHDPENCSAHDAGRLERLAEIVKSAHGRGIILRSLCVAPWEHTFFAVFEAESADAIEGWLDPTLELGCARITPVMDVMSTLPRLSEPEGE
ncbi:MAG: hypothetical protein M1274_07965 [Actinobacteria bacterium]|nr:hypothetical protein [Actinomycetota bacterium]